MVHVLGACGPTRVEPTIVGELDGSLFCRHFDFLILCIFVCVLLSFGRRSQVHLHLLLASNYVLEYLHINKISIHHFHLQSHPFCFLSYLSRLYFHGFVFVNHRFCSYCLRAECIPCCNVMKDSTSLVV